MIKLTPPVRPQPPSKPTLPKPPISLPPKLPPHVKLPPIDWKKKLGTVSLQDRLVAGRLHETLGAHVNSIAGKFAEATAGNATLKRGPDGVMRGPEGQPLMTVKLDGGRTAYVDPNTNQYYLPNDSVRYIRMPDSIQAKGPMALPRDAQFSNSYFTVDEVKALNRITNPRIVDINLGRVSCFERDQK
ncbi:MAG: hypothetical protein AB1938_13285 [Myxococcota bacterium]